MIETPILDKDNPPDLPPLQHMMSAREYLERINKPYPASALAADILRGAGRNRAVIIAPHAAHVQWLIQRAAPFLIERTSRNGGAFGPRLSGRSFVHSRESGAALGIGG